MEIMGRKGLENESRDREDTYITHELNSYVPPHWQSGILELWMGKVEGEAKGDFPIWVSEKSLSCRILCLLTGIGKFE